MARKKGTRASLAALKGWRTRRHNEKPRSEIAKKGWRTRRKNAKKFAGTPKRQKQPTGRKRGSPPTPPQPKIMLRLTTSIAYAKRQHRTTVYQSFKITSYWKTRAAAEKYLPQQKRDTIKALEMEIGFKEADWWFPATIQFEIKETTYDQKLIDAGPQAENEVV